MRVLHVVTGLAAGGAETQLRQLLRHSDYDAEVVALTNAGSVADEIRADGRPVGDLRMRTNRQVTILGQLIRLIRAGRYDVVHTHLYRAGVYGRVAARLANVPVVVSTEHSLSADGSLEGRTVNRGAWALYRLAERCGDLTIAVSSAVHGALRQRGIAEERLTTIPNGIDLDRYAFSAAARDGVRAEFGFAPGTQVIGTVGRLHQWKNVDLAIRAAAPLLGPDRQLLIVGDGAERAALAALADRLGVGGCVHFTGERLDIPALLSAMDAFVFASRTETFGLAAVEALAAGLPLVYQHCPALDEGQPIGPPGPPAYRVSPDESAYREALRTALESTVDRRAPAELGRFDVRLTARRVRQSYQDVAARQQVRSGAGRGAERTAAAAELAPRLTRRWDA